MIRFNKIAIIYNPTKDIAKVELFVRLAREKREDLQIDIHITDNFEDIEKKAHLAINRGCDLCVAAGGDGTVLGVLNAAMKHNTYFSILPLGTGNDFAKALSISDVPAAVDALFNGRIRTVDAGLCTYQSEDGQEREMYFSSTAGVGALARLFTFERYALTKILKNLLGNGVWPLLTVTSLFTSTNHRTELCLNNQRIVTQMRLFELSKVRSAGGVYFTPFADITNGIFDAWMLHDINSLKCLKVFMKADKTGGNHFDCAGLSYFSSDRDSNKHADLTEIYINPDRVLPVHLNGDQVGYTPCHFSLLPNALKILGPEV